VLAVPKREVLAWCSQASSTLKHKQGKLPGAAVKCMSDLFVSPLARSACCAPKGGREPSGALGERR